MKRPVLSATGVLLFLAGLCLVLRHDLAMLAWRQGKERLATGDYRGAVRDLGRAAAGSPGSLPIAFDTAVALYRQGDFRQARAGFLTASAATDPGMRTAALYNLGNCALRLGEKSAQTDRQAARDLFQEGVSRYGQALKIAPGAADARHNLALARARLAEMALCAGPDAQSGAGQSSAEPSGNGAARNGNDGEAASRDGESSSGHGKEHRREQEARSSGAMSKSAAQAGKSRPKLTKDQAEALLAEARGRETTSSLRNEKEVRGLLAQPAKDW